ncbi:MAG: nuclease-related domain-containing protein [Cardiobacteriaceae bacterium]|nr:nuclease-related domain-containing protein [Cardiobacteriaceae bacterium]
MAQILTPLRKNGMTIGEQRFVALLQKHLDDHYLVWYNIASPGKHSRYPDFIIFHAKYGLWCLEIKDWHMKSIKGMNKESVTLDKDEQSIQVTHPLQQARSSCFPFINNMLKDRYLRQSEGRYQGKLLFPWGFGVVMSNWQRKSIKKETQTLLEACFPPSLTWYKEDLLENRLSRHEFISKLHNMLPYRFPTNLTTAQVKRVRAHIFPECVIRGQE